VISSLLDAFSFVGTEGVVQCLESILSEDAESSEVTTWSELENIESGDVADIDTWEISSGLLQLVGFVAIDDQWALSHDIS